MGSVEPIYKLRDLRHAYHHRPVLEIESLDIRRAAIVGLLGPNGSGKSTLLRLLGFIDRPTRGSILYNGHPTLPFADTVKSQVTLLPQEPYLMKRSVFANVAYGLSLRGRSGNIPDRVQSALRQVGLSPERFCRRQWNELSGGEAQRVALAARLVLKPAVLLLDEPTASVDAASVELIRAASLNARNEWGTTLVIASHDRQWLDQVCDDMCYLFQGRVVDTDGSNLFFGPWEPRADGHYEKKLANGQCLVVPPPPGHSAVAVIHPSGFRIVPHKRETGPETGKDPCHLEGLITQMTLRRGREQLAVTLAVGDLGLTVTSAQHEADQQQLYPGKKIRVRYLPADVEWISGRN
ncbi:MAG: ABC transporter ATP-binding protein [Desulfobacteraceae bacterium]|nr:ABC transporter ATP-binding protein [Desulfobacteraceae bacterium]